MGKWFIKLRKEGVRINCFHEVGYFPPMTRVKKFVNFSLH